MSNNVGGGGGDDGGASKSSSNNVVSSRSRKNAPGSRIDIGWKHGVDVLGNSRKVKCNYCSKIVSGGIFRFKHHLAGTREDSEPCATVPEEVKMLMLKIVAEAKVNSLKRRKMTSNIEEGCEETQEIETINASQRKGKGVAIQSTINQMMKKNIKEEVDQQVARFFYTSAIPFNVIKNVEFAKMCEMIGKYGIGYKPPSYHEIREKLLKQAVTQTDAMIEEFKEEWKQTGCTIMSDGWTDKKRRSICNFLVNSPKGTVFLYSLDTSDISKTTDKVFKMLDDVVEFVGEDNVIQVVTDNAANYKAAGEMLMETRKRLYWTPCAAHCIDLMLEDMEKHLKVHQVTIKKGRRITTYIYSRTMLISMLKKHTEGRDLVRPGLTRFATAYLTLSCLNDNKASLMTLFSSDEWKKSKFASTQEGRKVANMALDSRLWKNIIICLKAVAPLIGVLRLVDSDERPAMGFIYEAMDSAKEKIKANFKNVKKSYEPVWKIIDERWDKQLHRPLHAAAYYLNPQFHYLPNFNNSDFEVKQGLYNCMTRLVDDITERNKMSAQLADFHHARGMFGLDIAKNSRKMVSPGEWWELYGDSCPELQKFAIRVLSLTCSSSGCERNWSSFEMVHTKRRNRLHQKKMNDLVYVMYNLKLKSRLIRKNVVLPFDDIHSDDEWIVEEDEEITTTNVDEEIVQEYHENDDRTQYDNVEFGATSSFPTLDNIEVENLVEEDVGEDEDDESEDVEEDDEEDDDANDVVEGLDF